MSAALLLHWTLGLVSVFVLFVLLVIYKHLRTPIETNPSKLFFRLFPKPRWECVKNTSADKRRILLLTYGTRGDVQPLVLLAQELKRQNFHVALCTCTSFREFVLIQNHVTFISCGVDSVLQPTSLQSSLTFSHVLQVYANVYADLSKGMYQACLEFNPDLILSPALVRGIGAQCAEKLGIPHWSLHFAPSNTPTFAFPPPEYLPSTYEVEKKLKYIQRNFGIAQAALASGLSRLDEEFRCNVLHLPKLSVVDLLADVEREPSFHAYSPVLSPKPNDWSDWTLVCGAITGNEDQDARLDSKLLEFVFQSKHRDPLVYLGLGSMENVTEVVYSLIGELLSAFPKIRIIVCGQNAANRFLRKQIKWIQSAPHALLFPYCDAVIHHGGAGTTHACVKAGVPQLIFPVLLWSDQPFWAQVVESKELGYRITERDVGKKLERCLLFKYRCKQVKKMAHPDGRKTIAEYVNQYFNSN